MTSYTKKRSTPAVLAGAQKMLLARVASRGKVLLFSHQNAKILLLAVTLSRYSSNSTCAEWAVLVYGALRNSAHVDEQWVGFVYSRSRRGIWFDLCVHHVTDRLVYKSLFPVSWVAWSWCRTSRRCGKCQFIISFTHLLASSHSQFSIPRSGITTACRCLGLPCRCAAVVRSCRCPLLPLL